MEKNEIVKPQGAIFAVMAAAQGLTRAQDGLMRSDPLSAYPLSPPSNRQKRAAQAKAINGAHARPRRPFAALAKRKRSIQPE